MSGICYSIKKNRIGQGLFQGFEMSEDGALQTIPSQAHHYLYLRALDSTEDDATWGRLHLKAELDENMVCYIYVVAMNQDSFYRNHVATRIDDFFCNSEEDPSTKREFLQRVNAQKYVNQEDILLYQMTGRYLYLVIEVLGQGNGVIKDVKVEKQGDNFMNTFPEIYRENNSFFHRYLSVFSSIYNDFQENLDHLDSLLELDTCPKEFLLVYARWMGIDISDDFVEEPWLRTLVKEGYHLNKMKGTKWAVERVAEIILGEPVQVLERNMMREYVEEEDYREFEKLYGNSPYDVTVLIKTFVTENQKSRLVYLVRQFQPIRSRIQFLYLGQDGMLDGHSYIDMNARITKTEDASLDTRQLLDEVITIL